MSTTCKRAVFDPDTWSFYCQLTGQGCTSGKHFPEFDKCVHRHDNDFIYDDVKEKFGELFPNYARDVMFWSQCNNFEPSRFSDNFFPYL